MEIIRQIGIRFTTWNEVSPCPPTSEAVSKPSRSQTALPTFEPSNLAMPSERMGRSPQPLPQLASGLESR
jgi:hypothetical protein